MIQGPGFAKAVASISQLSTILGDVAAKMSPFLDRAVLSGDTTVILDAAKGATADIRSGKGRVQESWW
jgi:hypothetical protein